MITLARPELLERRAGWGAGQRSFTSLYLEPLSEAAMRELLEGLVPGLPERLHEQILARAEGVPLYAVETVRMLLDRGLLAQEGPVYQPTGEIETLEVPETLHALIAARLDGLSPEERRLLQDGAVLGKTFSREALAALAGAPETELEQLLSRLVRKEVLGVQSDPRSPERGYYGFLQDLVRHVAYETLSKRERKTRHLAAAAHLEGAFSQEDEVAEVLASHYLAAFHAAPDADDAETIRASAGAKEGKRYYEQAAELTDEPLQQADLLEQAGRLAARANRPAEARKRIERSMALRSEAGDRRGVARASAALADVDVVEGRLDEAATRLQDAVAELEQGGPSAELAAALAQLGRVRVVAGHADAADDPLERALALAERLLLPEVLVEALTSKALALYNRGRLIEARILLEAAAERAYAEQLYVSALRAENNLGVVLEASDRLAEAVELLDRTIALARRRGDRRWESNLRTGGLIELILLGRWDEALTVAAEEEPLAAGETARASLLDIALIHCERGQLEQALALFASGEEQRESDQAQGRAGHSVLEARVLRAEGRNAEALAATEPALALRDELSIADSRVKRGLVEAIEAALALHDLDRAEELLAIPEALDPGELTPFLQAHTARLRARLDAVRGERERVDERFRTAAALFREFDFVFYLAVTQLEHGEWLTAQNRADEAKPLLAEARASFERLQATPWLERTAQVSPVGRKPEAVTAGA